MIRATFRTGCRLDPDPGACHDGTIPRRAITRWEREMSATDDVRGSGDSLEHRIGEYDEPFGLPEIDLSGARLFPPARPAPRPPQKRRRRHRSDPRGSDTRRSS